MGFDIDLIFRIVGVGILVSAAHYVLKNSGKEDYAFLATLGGLAIVLIWVIQLLGNFFDQVRTVFKLW
ncbi:stage III sporulation protein AC [Peptococcaceae bacterium SCADC1_2_3]|jgi:stage III sporulation protein AC|nr:stage III sporulation protein AC [Peptococcaceae bacterium SCADC1_2_3]KFI34337.1 stage III sporulation protein AC [Peptococcaceae bacterium SCADC1_2_3]HBQ28890.1 stage III sporulation protein AC [Desulfotomaculum sp.]HCJ78787.1 stage III sporulation protein AC [Desulfotomaculum sp.]